MDDQLYRDIVSGRRCGAAAAVVRGGLRAASVPYSVAVRLRNRAYDLGLKRTYRVEVPVVSVGNLTLGGTGKTPLVEHLARWFRAAGLRVCILSRGYGAADGAANDEAQVLAENLPEVPHLQGRDRVALARRAIDVHHAQVLLLDDGFQHRRLARDLDLVILDALDPLGGNNLFPRGLLREPLSSLRRADLILLNRADLLSDRQRQRIHDYCAAAAGRDLTGRLPWIEIAQRPCGFTGKRGVTSAQRAAWNTERRIGRGECWNDSGGLRVSGRSSPAVPRLALRAPHSIRSAFDRVAAFCGIGNPAGFRRTLEQLGWHVRGFRIFPDHHAYTPADVASLSAWAAALDVEAVVTTQKDLVKLDTPTLGGRPLLALAIEVAVLHGADLLERQLSALITRQGGERSSQGVEESRSQVIHRPHALPTPKSHATDHSSLSPLDP